MLQLKFPHSSRTALTSTTWNLSFDELHRLREIISRKFLNSQEQHPIRVLGCLNDDMHALLALLTITEVCDYLPINPQLTQMELKQLIQDAGNIDTAIVSTSLINNHSACIEELIPLIIDWDKLVLEAKSLLENNKNSNKPEPSNPPLSMKGRLILHTSGSTGTPKRVPITIESINASAKNICNSLELTSEDHALNILPTFHIGALVDVLLAPFHAKGAVSISADRQPHDIVKTLISIRPTWLQLVPTILLRLVEDMDPESLKEAGKSLSFVRCISAPLTPDLKAKAESLLGCPIIEMYGMTETAGQITTNARGGVYKSGSVGQAHDIPVILLDNFGNAVDNGKMGEVCVSGPSVFHGYEGTDQSKTFFDEWFRTGDLGEFDHEGYLFLRGRIKEMINVGGEKISPLEIENAAISHPNVLEAAAYALPHPTLGEQVGLTVACSKEIDLDKISEYLKPHLTDFKRPRKVLRVDKLPRLPNAKVDRLLLKRNGEEALIKRTLSQSEVGEDQGIDNPIELLISKLWAQELNSRRPMGNDDFFDMGGDSLSANSFLVSLEKALEREIPPNQLFDTPTFSSLIESLLLPQVASEKVKTPAVAYVERIMSGWPVKTYLSDGLFHGVGTLRNRQIVFWSTQSFEEFQNIVGHLGSQFPMYITCSLYKYPKRAEQDFHDLAKALANEIQIIQPLGEIVLGGFCGGGKVMHYVADHLVTAGRTIKLFLSFDYWMNRPTAFPVMHVMSNSSNHSGRKMFPRYQLALSTLHPNGSEAIGINATHNFTAEHNTLTPYLARIHQAITNGINTSQVENPSTSTIWSFEERKQAPLAAIKIIKRDRLFTHDKNSKLGLKLRNKSNNTWLKTEESGLSVVVRLLNLDTHCRVSCAGYTDIPASLNPGDEIELFVDITFPKLKLPLLVEVLLLNQGIQVFKDKRSGRHRYLVIPSPMAWIG